MQTEEEFFFGGGRVSSQECRRRRLKSFPVFRLRLSGCGGTPPAKPQAANQGFCNKLTSDALSQVGGMARRVVSPAKCQYCKPSSPGRQEKNARCSFTRVGKPTRPT